MSMLEIEIEYSEIIQKTLATDEVFGVGNLSVPVQSGNLTSLGNKHIPNKYRQRSIAEMIGSGCIKPVMPEGAGKGRRQAPNLSSLLKRAKGPYF